MVAKKRSTHVAPTFFATPAKWRAWLAKHHDKHSELLVGFHKVGSGKPSITWPESVDEALCFGWIDGVRKRVDDLSYTIRFTPRKKASIWSAINIARVEALNAEGRMMPAGLRAFEARSEHKSRIYAYEQPEVAALTADEEKSFRSNKVAWEYYSTSAPSYRKRTLWWVVSAKQATTRAKRLARLIEASAAKRWAY